MGIKKSLNTKVSAFTITEMLVVLILSSILILIAMSVLNLVQKQIQLVENNYSNNDKVRTLERLLWQDFNKYQFYYNKNQDVLKGVNPLDSVSYLFENNYIIRKKDTLFLPIHQKTFLLDAKEVTDGQIDAIELALTKEYQNTVLFCYQTKDAKYNMNDQ